MPWLACSRYSQVRVEFCLEHLHVSDTALGVGVARILFLGVRHCSDRHRKPKITLEGSSVLEYSEVR